ncbi:MAG: alpha/beta hydrolase [Promethearchaeota archaeon]
MKNTISSHFLGTKGLSEKEIRKYYKNLKNLRQAVNSNSNDRMASEFFFELHGGLRFFYQEWSAISKGGLKTPKALIFAFHEIYGCSDSFYPLADALNPLGAAVIGIDYRGHGRTGGYAGGNTGDLKNFQNIYNDIKKLIKFYKQKYDIPIYFVGYDIGALIAMQVALKNKDLEIDGLILVSPIWRLKNTLKHFFLYPAISIGELFSKGKPIHRVLEEKIEETYFDEYKILARNNPFRLREMSLRMFKNILDLINTAHFLIIKTNIPCLILQGTADPIVDHVAVHRLYKNWKHPNKFIRFYENAGHNLLVDRFTQEIFSEIASFIRELRE